MEEFLYAAWPWALLLLNVGLAAWVTIHAVLRKRDSRAAIAWTGLAWLAPIVGPFAYLCFGVNRIQRKAATLKLREAWQGRPELRLSRHDIGEAARATKEHPHLVGLDMLALKLSGHPLVPGNRVEPLIDGDETYPAMIDAIGRAERSVGLLSYIFDSDRAGDRVLDALVEADRRGVRVRVLVDDVGGRYSKVTMVRRLRQLGIAAASFLPTRLPRLPIFANLRNHRKILVVDGSVGFAGGTNIREGHWRALGPRAPVQCLHFRLQGPVVAHLQEAFATDWAFVTGETLSGEDWFPKPRRAGEIWARGIADGPDEDFETLSKVIFAALSVADSRVRIVSPYFLPDARLIEALCVAALRGVRVEVFLPSDNNIPIVDWAATAQLWQMLDAGCRVFVTAPPFDHTKLMIVDDIWTLIGSANWDPRSLRLNFEFNVECYDAGLAGALHGIVDDKARDAREILLDEVDGRRFPTRLRDGLARLLSPYL